MKSSIREEIEKILATTKRGGYYTVYIDKRKKGCYRMKFAYLDTVTDEQINKIYGLSKHITKVKNIVSIKHMYGPYKCLAVHTNCRPLFLRIKNSK